jgi:cobalt-zinc-cadmium resistance protein CzcA
VDVIQAIPGATDVEATHIGGQSEVVVTPDRGRLARYGITIGDVNNLVNEALSGAAVTSYYDQDKRFDVVLKMNEHNRQSIDAIGELRLAVPGTQVGNGPHGGAARWRTSSCARACRASCVKPFAQRDRQNESAGPRPGQLYR